MLSDGYVEQIVKGKTGAANRAAFIGGIIAIVFGFLAILFVDAALGLTLIILGGVMAGVASARKDVEFEYLMVNDEVEISKIIAKQSRKKVYSFSNGDVKLIAKPDSIYLDNEYQANADIRSINFTDGNDTDDLFVFVLNKESSIEAVTLKLSEKTFNHVSNFFKGKYKE